MNRHLADVHSTSQASAHLLFMAYRQSSFPSLFHFAALLQAHFMVVRQETKFRISERPSPRTTTSLEFVDTTSTNCCSDVMHIAVKRLKRMSSQAHCDYRPTRSLNNKHLFGFWQWYLHLHDSTSLQWQCRTCSSVLHQHRLHLCLRLLRNVNNISTASCTPTQILRDHKPAHRNAVPTHS